MSDEWLEAEMVLATDDVIDSRYGKLQIPESMLREMAEQINTRELNLSMNHDPSDAIRARKQVAFVERDEQGKVFLRLNAEVHREDWQRWEAGREARGALGGMSLSVNTPIVIPEQPAGIFVSGDAADFEDPELAELAEFGPPGVPVQADRLYQFGAEIEPVCMTIDFVVATLVAVPPGVIANWITRAIDRLRTRATELGRPPALDVRFRREPDGSTELDVRYWPDDANAAARALKSIMENLGDPEGSD